MSTDNGEFSDNLVKYALDLGVNDAAINQSITHHHL